MSAPAACGTLQGYRVHLRNRQTPCDACQAAARAYRAQLKGRDPAAAAPARASAPEPAVALADLSDAQVIDAITGRTVTYRYALAAGEDEAHVAKVVKFGEGRKGRRVVTFWDHVNGHDRADGVVRSLYVDQIVRCG
jgi:hypothetical protein